MKPVSVHILATCIDRAMVRNTLMVFETLRIGFPNARVFVYGNGLDAASGDDARKAARKVGAEFHAFPVRPHGQWIESLIGKQTQPFWICDTDITFHKSVEGWFEGATDLFAGRYEPEFFEPWTQSQHVARLHPSLMWFNPRSLRAAIRAWPGTHPWLNSVEKTLIRWTFVPVRGDLCFYDTCAGLHHALGGTHFTRDQNDCFSHRFSGTYSHLIGATEAQLRAHEEICKTATP